MRDCRDYKTVLFYLFIGLFFVYLLPSIFPAYFISNYWFKDTWPDAPGRIRRLNGLFNIRITATWNSGCIIYITFTRGGIIL